MGVGDKVWVRVRVKVRVGVKGYSKTRSVTAKNALQFKSGCVFQSDGRVRVRVRLKG